MSAIRILVVRGGAIGDFVMTLPAIGALRERWPQAHLEILGYPHITELARGPGYADATRSIEARSLAAFFVPDGPLDPEWMAYFRSFHLVISYLYDPDGVFAANVRRCGVRQLVEASPRPTDRHAAEHYCAPLESLAIHVENPRPRLRPGEEQRAFAGRYLGIEQGAAVRWVALHPGSGSPLKNWPVSKFAELARWLLDAPAVSLLLICGEADEAPVRELAAALRQDSYRLVRGLRLMELAAVLERCAAFVGNDSGITHLAAAVGTPTVGLFGPASASIWEPRGEQVQVVRFGRTDLEQVKARLSNWLEERPA